MLLISEQLKQMSSEAREISEGLKQLIDSLNSVAGDTKMESDVLQGFLSYSQQQITGNPPKITLLAADVQQWLTELEVALINDKGRLEVSQKALCYANIMNNLHKRLDNICLLLAD